MIKVRKEQSESGRLVENGVLFEAFPHQPYLARKGVVGAIVDSFMTTKDRKTLTKWSVTIYVARQDGGGRTDNRAQQHFDKPDEAFAWAAREIIRGV